MIPCTRNISACPPDQFTKVQQYGPAFMTQFRPYMDPTSKNGAFLDVSGVVIWDTYHLSQHCILISVYAWWALPPPYPNPPPFLPSPLTIYFFPSQACLIHGSTNSPINGLLNFQAFQSWLAGNTTHWWTELCGGSDEAGPCDMGSACQKYPH